MIFIRAVITLSFALLLYASATFSSIVSVSADTPFAGACEVAASDELGNVTPIAGVFLASFNTFKEAQRISVEKTQVQAVATAEAETAEEPAEEPSLNENPDVIALACLIEGEGANLAFNERAAIALTACYRTDMSQWPDSIQGNIYMANQYAPAGHYSESSLEAAEYAYTLWVEGRGSEVLPSEYYSFFGNGSHNYFYNKSLQIYDMPGVSMPGDIYDQMTQIIPALRRSAEQETENAENPEVLDESMEQNLDVLPSDDAATEQVEQETGQEVLSEQNLSEQAVQSEQVAQPAQNGLAELTQQSEPIEQETSQDEAQVIAEAVDDVVSDEQISSDSSGDSEISADLGNVVTAE